MKLESGKKYILQDESGNSLVCYAVSETVVSFRSFLGGFLQMRDIDITTTGLQLTIRADIPVAGESPV